MGYSKYVTKTFQKEYEERGDALKDRLTQWRAEAPIVRIARPTNLARARSLGYKAKQGVIVVRVRVRRGLSKRQKPRGGRKPSKMGRFYAYRKSLQAIAEERAAVKYTNTAVLNSYFVGEDGNNKFYEVVLLDRAHPAITSDPVYSKIVNSKGRAQRGLTSAGKRHRGLNKKGKGSFKTRPSVRARERQ
ncbi:MAG: 50S ribosomal protein L15e [Candidatus Micrarchaeaceae archaeon]